MNKGVRRFLVFADVRDVRHVEEIPSETPQDEIDERLKETLDTLISNERTGWVEIDEAQWAKFKKNHKL